MFQLACKPAPSPATLRPYRCCRCPQPRKGCFEVRGPDGEVFVSLLVSGFHILGYRLSTSMKMKRSGTAGDNKEQK